MNRGGSTATPAAAATTTGVYHRAKLVMKFSVGAFRAEAFSTSSSTLAMEDSLKGLVTRSFKEAVKLIVPAIRVSPIRVLRGTDSPVRAEVSRREWPDRTSPSSGTFSPGLTKMISPTLTCSGGTC